VKQAAKEGELQLFFMDEAGMSTVPNVQRAWSPRSLPHTANAGVSRRRVNVLGALNYGANTLTHVLHEGSVTRAHIIDFIDNLAKQHSHIDKPSFVVLDNASVHHHIDAEKIREWASEHHFFLCHIPAYSPELNQIEILWKQAKYHWRKFTTWTKDQLLDEAGKIFQGYGDKFKISYA
jgi:hypothetical protein